MKLEEFAKIRTGLVTARKKKSADGMEKTTYKLLNLKCVDSQGNINEEFLEEYTVSETLKDEYLTQRGDILVRLSAPYSVSIINEAKLCGLVVPSHFAIVRVDTNYFVPSYVYWVLSRDKTRAKLMKDSSGSSAFGTISSGLIGNIPINMMPIQKQIALGELSILSQKEQRLLKILAEEKRKYNNCLISSIYDEIKRGK